MASYFVQLSIAIPRVPTLTLENPLGLYMETYSYTVGNCGDSSCIHMHKLTSACSGHSRFPIHPFLFLLANHIMLHPVHWLLVSISSGI